MLTEEKIQKLLDDLRFGKYDTPNYSLECRAVKDCGSLCLKDLKNKTELFIRFYKSSKYTLRTIVIFGQFYHWKKHKRKPAQVEVFFANNLPCEIITISDELCNSLHTFAKEQLEKDKLLAKNNVETTFNL